MSERKMSRRGLLTAAGAVAAYAGATRALGATDAGSPRPLDTPPPTPDAGAAPPIPPATIAAAELVAGVRYTDAERTMMGATLVEQLAMVRARRALPIPNELSPATSFDPRLPGFKLPTASTFRLSDAKVPPLPTSEEELAYAPVWQLSRWLQARQLTSEQLTEVYLARIKRLGPKLECIAHLTEDLARTQARAADRERARGRSRGPLHGIPFGAKDLLDTANVPTTWGAEPYRDRIPKADAWAIQKLQQAGAVLLAKTTLGALAYGDIWAGGRTRNPWVLEEGSSGSSAGSASGTAAGLMAFGVGSETLGSIVSPSMRCGTTGLRPTFGRIGRSGAMALCWSMDKLGPIARSAEDTALVLAALNGPDPQDPGSIGAPFAYDGRRPLKGLRIGHDPAWFGEGAQEPDRRALEALKSLGVQVVELKLPELAVDPLIPILLAEAAAAFEDLTLNDLDDQLDWQTPEAWPNTFRAARFLTAIDLIQADRLRRRVMVELGKVFEGVDAIFGPSFAGNLLTATNFTGHPSLTLRAGFIEIDKPRGLTDAESAATKPFATKRRVPHGVTLWGRLFDEGTILRVGVALERALGVWNQRPPVG